ncbi:E3 ubiquitin-protein ligase MARCH2 [Gossypium australe]|uniref:E3 ubiquitin-protein ligase MARCH2 n=1 Tax=Gossypium australe TaxID=47621 RepID=A0A5B6WB71_9ROSI|nr:E3 ubiquitin-protein ligase MARCH2 [Gossypium australe]
MDQEERCDRVEISKYSSQFDSNSINGAVFVKNSDENAGLRLQNDEFGSCKHVEISYVSGIGSVSSQNGQSIENSSSLVEGNVNNGVASSEGSIETIETRVIDERLSQVGDECVVETIVMVESNGVLAEMPVKKVPERDDSCVIDINGSIGGTRWFKDSYDGERVCRICHLNSEQLLESNDSISTTAAVTDLIQLGCGCKDELGIVHSHCAEAWFKLKGNRMCEICGQTAENITGVRDNRFIEDWHEQGSTSGVDFISSDQGTGCWRGQQFCNFLMACLVISFVLPWFFHVNMF